jgi:hypothetical protein
MPDFDKCVKRCAVARQRARHAHNMWAGGAQIDQERAAHDFV